MASAGSNTSGAKPNHDVFDAAIAPCEIVVNAASAALGFNLPLHESVSNEHW
jgi:hypothetical protein